MTARHLYVHVPFCRRRCVYCDFAIAIRRRVPHERFVDAILSEARLRRGAGASLEEVVLETIYFGGGTPSLLDDEALARLLGGLVDQVEIASHPEITLEANPEDVTPDRARRWRALGVNRVSLGVQSFDEQVLRWMHRSHGADDPPAALDALRAAGIDNISVDLMFALPPALNRDWAADLARVVALGPPHVSLYGLTLEPRTPVHRWVERGVIAPAADDRYADEYLEAHRLLAKSDYAFYEVSNASRGARVSQHNSAYWSGGAYLGLGPGAHSFDGEVRSWNIGAWAAYEGRVRMGQLPRAGHERLSVPQQRLERLFLGLRTARGVRVDDIPPALVARWHEAGWTHSTRGHIGLSPSGWLLIDAIVADLTRFAQGT